MYFGKIPTITYKMFNNSNSVNVVRNITLCSKFTDFFKQNGEQLFVDYKIRDGDKPETLAYRVYGNAQLHWVILLFNNIVNPYFEWPLEYSELESQILSTYPGSAVFVDITSSFYKTNGKKLSPEKSQFIVGNEISHENDHWTGTIRSWDPTLRKIEIENISGILDDDIPSTYTGKIITENIDGDEFEATMRRVVFDNTYALHHFEDDEGNYLDPYEDFIGRTLASDTESSLNQSYLLKNYIENSADTNVIVNRRYEEVENDNRRNIKLLKVDYLGYVIDTYNNLYS